MGMSRIKGMVATLAMIGYVAGAQAADIDLNALNDGSNDFGPVSIVAGSFVDKIHFALTQGSAGGFGVGSLNFSLRGVPYLNIDNLHMSLFNDSHSLLGGGLDFMVDALPPGNYYLQVAGESTGSAGGMYAGSISVTSLPVPEPGIGSSLVAGLLMLSFMAMRRRNI